METKTEVLNRTSRAVMAMLPEAYQARCFRVLGLDSEPQDKPAEVHEPGTIAPVADAEAKAPRLPRTDKAVAVIPIHGSIGQSVDWFTDVGTRYVGNVLDELMTSPRVGAVVFWVDSPGGSVYGTPELAEKIQGYRGTKPMYAVTEGMMTSAAYWIGAAADKVFASPSSEVGSIGVWTAHGDVSKMWEDFGVKITLVSAGKYKVEGNPFEPLGDEARAEMQRGVDRYYDMFLESVAKSRGTTKAAVRDGYGEGRVLGAEAAKAAGMIDGIATLQEVLGAIVKPQEAKGKGGLARAKLAIEAAL